jgi:hypothetical protein
MQPKQAKIAWRRVSAMKEKSENVQWSSLVVVDALIKAQVKRL